MSIFCCQNCPIPNVKKLYFYSQNYKDITWQCRTSYFYCENSKLHFTVFITTRGKAVKILFMLTPVAKLLHLYCQTVTFLLSKLLLTFVLSELPDLYYQKVIFQLSHYFIIFSFLTNHYISTIKTDKMSHFCWQYYSVSAVKLPHFSVCLIIKPTLPLLWKYPIFYCQTVIHQPSKL